MSELEAALKQCAERVEDNLDMILKASDGPEARVIEAMRYSVLGGGKRVRPFLVTQSAALFGVGESRAYRAAAAIEMVHCYSLVHDDLPAMDDDDLRRGRPTCHKQFDEATAILAGDALLTKAFEVLAATETHDNPAIRADLCLALAKASGDAGMVGGQMLDLVA
ncbi:MAG: polyprenyl synthetase family protein, partial [Proteobacteria bacterium]|nr:polyprenyl synthetase family protein [Pseudomonadota bacterium]